VDGFNHVVAVFTGHLELEATLQRIEEGHRRAFVDAHRAVALYVAVAAYRAQAGAGAADIAAQQHQVGDFLDGLHRMTMLGDAHRPAHDYVLALEVHACGAFDINKGQARLLHDMVPRGVVEAGDVIENARSVLIQKCMIEHGRFACGLGIALPLQEELGHAAQQRHVAAQCRAQVGRVGRTVAVGEHFQRMLRVLETFQPALLERVDAHYLGAALDRLAQWFEHARVVGAGVLPQYENCIRVLEIIKGHGAFTHADALRQGHAAGLVAHVRAIREVVGAKRAHKQLVQIRRFVAGPA